MALIVITTIILFIREAIPKVNLFLFGLCLKEGGGGGHSESVQGVRQT